MFKAQYRNIYFIQGENADEMLKQLDEHGPLQFIDYLAGSGLLDSIDSADTTDRQPWGVKDYTDVVEYDNMTFVISTGMYGDTTLGVTIVDLSEEDAELLNDITDSINEKIHDIESDRVKSLLRQFQYQLKSEVLK